MHSARIRHLERPTEEELVVRKVHGEKLLQKQVVAVYLGVGRTDVGCLQSAAVQSPYAILMPSLVPVLAAEGLGTFCLSAMRGSLPWVDCHIFQVIVVWNCIWLTLSIVQSFRLVL